MKFVDDGGCGACCGLRADIDIAYLSSSARLSWLSIGANEFDCGMLPPPPGNEFDCGMLPPPPGNDDDGPPPTTPSNDDDGPPRINGNVDIPSMASFRDGNVSNNMELLFMLRFRCWFCNKALYWCTALAVNKRSLLSRANSMRFNSSLMAISNLAFMISCCRCCVNKSVEVAFKYIAGFNEFPPLDKNSGTFAPSCVIPRFDPGGNLIEGTASERCSCDDWFCGCGTSVVELLAPPITLRKEATPDLRMDEACCCADTSACACDLLLVLVLPGSLAFRAFLDAASFCCWQHVMDSAKSKRPFWKSGWKNAPESPPRNWRTNPQRCNLRVKLEYLALLNLDGKISVAKTFGL